MTVKLDPIHAAIDLRCEVHRSGSYTLQCGTTPAAYVLHEYRHGMPEVPVAACKMHASARSRRRHAPHPLTLMTPDVEQTIRARIQSDARREADERAAKRRESEKRYAAQVAEKRAHAERPWTASLVVDTSEWKGETEVSVRVHPDEEHGSQAWEAFNVELVADPDVPATLRIRNAYGLTTAATVVLLDVLAAMTEWASDLNDLPAPARR